MSGVDNGLILRPRVDLALNNIGILGLRAAINEGWTIFDMAGGFLDEFHDETGIDAGASVQATYDAAGDFYRLSGASLIENLSEAAAGSNSLDGSVGLHLGARFTLANAGEVTQVRFEVALANGTGYSAGIWTDNAGSPGTQIGANGAQVSVSTTGIKTAPIVAGALAAGTYWLVLERTGGGTGGITVSNAASANGAFDRVGRSNTITAITTNISGGGQWPRMELTVDYGAAAQLQSISHDPGFVPVASRAVILADPAPGAVLNTDLIAEFSRDGGTTWAAGTLAKLGDYSASVEIWEAAEADISGQPSGQALRSRVRSPTGTAGDIHAWYVQAR